jgi:hypothetical protein
MEVNGQLHTLASLPQGMSPLYQFYKGLGGPQSRSGRYGEQKNLLPLPGTEPRLLYRLSYPDSHILRTGVERRSFQL